MILPELEMIVAFTMAATVLALTPGPDMAYVSARTLAGGHTAGAAAALGVLAGILVHTLLAAIGLSSLFQHSQLAFDVVKYAGAGYLVWLAIRMWREGAAEASVRVVAPVRPGRVFVEGLLTNILNPKVALFFLALLPQFAVPAKGGVASQMIVLGLVMVAVGMVTLLGVVWISAGARSAVRTSPRANQLFRRLTALLFFGLAVRLALSQRS